MRTWTATYVMVDAWRHRPDPEDRDRNFVSHSKHERSYQLARDNTRAFAHRRVMLRNLTTEAVCFFADASIDWLFIDALHTYSAVRRELRLWWPKLRPGGLLTGDDYGDAVDQELTPNGSGIAWNIARRLNWGVVRAVNEFARENNLALHVTWERGRHVHIDVPVTAESCYFLPAWYLVKPTACVESAAGS